ncbi:MAG: FtsX-like permease family protein [Aquificota bacterium]|nr:FtsX-like permease family protein [Aquificota bacterium]
MQKLLGKPNEVNELVVRVEDVDSAVRIARKIEEDTGYDAQSWQEAYSNFLQLFKIQKTITYLVVGAILLVSAFGIFNILMMTVLEKQRDIAILKAMGYSSRDITLVFMIQGLFIGVLGVVIGSVSAYLIQEYLSSVEIDLEGLLRAKGFILDRSLLYYVGGTLFAPLFLLRCLRVPRPERASRLNPVDIFRSGESEDRHCSEGVEQVNGQKTEQGCEGREEYKNEVCQEKQERDDGYDKGGLDVVPVEERLPADLSIDRAQKGFQRIPEALSPEHSSPEEYRKGAYQREVEKRGQGAG